MKKMSTLRYPSTLQQSETEFYFDILEFKPQEMRWKEFYKRIIDLISNYKQGNYIYEFAKEGEITKKT